MLAIFVREWRASFTGMVGYIVTAVTVAFFGLYWFNYNLYGQSPDFGIVLYSSTILLLFVLPAVTMRSFADERRSKTDQLLLTAPVSIPAIVGGKYLAQLAVFGVPCAVAAVLPLLLAPFGPVLFVNAYAALFAYCLLAAACIAVGTWVSAVTENQIVAYLATFGLLLLAYLSSGIRTLFTVGDGTALLAFCAVLIAAAFTVGFVCKSVLAGCAVFAAGAAVLAALFWARPAWLVAAFSAALQACDLFAPFEGFVGGLFSVGGVVYYLSVIALFLFLTGQTLEKRRWS